MNTKRLLTERETGVELSVSRATLRRLAAADELVPVRIRGCVRYTREALDDYVRRLEAERAKGSDADDHEAA